jgi:hypothetical protein
MAARMKAAGDYYGPEHLRSPEERSAMLRACRKIEQMTGARFTTRKIDGEGFGVWRVK